MFSGWPQAQSLCVACLSLKSALDPLIFYFITFLPSVPRPPYKCILLFFWLLRRHTLAKGIYWMDRLRAVWGSEKLSLHELETLSVWITLAVLGPRITTDAKHPDPSALWYLATVLHNHHEMFLHQIAFWDVPLGCVSCKRDFMPSFDSTMLNEMFLAATST